MKTSKLNFHEFFFYLLWVIFLVCNLLLCIFHSDIPSIKEIFFIIFSVIFVNIINLIRYAINTLQTNFVKTGILCGHFANGCSQNRLYNKTVLRNELYENDCLKTAFLITVVSATVVLAKVILATAVLKMDVLLYDLGRIYYNVSTCGFDCTRRVHRTFCSY